MKKIVLLLTIVFCNCNRIVSQVLSGKCVESLTASIGFNPQGLGYQVYGWTDNYNEPSYASGDYQIFPAYGNNCNTLKKVILIVEGYDVLNDFNTSVIYNYFSRPENNFLGGRLRNMGYDIITLNFADPKNYIESNAMLLVELIKRINNSKVGDDPLTIVGVSMGGLVTRYALSYMEANNINHQTKLFISYDTPNKGANIPFGLQQLMLDYHNNIYTIGPIAPYWAYLANPAASEMLRYHVLSYEVPSLSYNFVKFMNKLKNLNGCNGYPKNCRNIALSLGSLNASGQLSVKGNPMLSGGIAFEYSSSVPYLGNLQDGYVCTVPTSPPLSPGSVGVGTENKGLTVNTLHYLNPSIPIDIAPGGYNEILGYVADGIADIAFSGLKPTVKKSCINSCFIPTISALDYKETDLFYNISNDFLNNTQLSKTPFDEIFNSGYSSNLLHVGVVPPDIADWLYDKITNADTNSSAICGGYDININNQTFSTNYANKAQHDISIADVTVNNSAVFEVSAGDEIILGDGFNVEQGAELIASIESCDSLKPSKQCNYVEATLKTDFSDSISDLLFTGESYNNTDLNGYTVKYSISQVSKDLLKISAFPNPAADGNFYYNFPTGDDISNVSNLIVNIFDNKGSLIKTERKLHKGCIDISALSSGVYVLQFIDGDTSLYQKIIKE